MDDTVSSFRPESPAEARRAKNRHRGRSGRRRPPRRRPRRRRPRRKPQERRPQRRKPARSHQEEGKKKATKKKVSKEEGHQEIGHQEEDGRRIPLLAGESFGFAPGCDWILLAANGLRLLRRRAIPFWGRAPGCALALGSVPSRAFRAPSEPSFSPQDPESGELLRHSMLIRKLSISRSNSLSSESSHGNNPGWVSGGKTSATPRCRADSRHGVGFPLQHSVAASAGQRVPMRRCRRWRHSRSSRSEGCWLRPLR